MSKHIPFVYKWTNLVDQKWYIGSRTAKNCHPDDGYICSSKKLKPLIESNPELWVREIIKTGSAEEMLLLETELLVAADAKNDPMSYNEHNSDGKFSMAGKPGGRTGKAPWNKGKTKETDPRIAQYANTLSEVNKGKPFPVIYEGREPWNKGKKGLQTAWNKGLPPEQQPFYGKTVSEETRKKISESQKGSKNVRYGKEPWNKGQRGVIKQTEESNQKRREKLVGIPRSEEVKAKIRATKAANKLTE